MIECCKKQETYVKSFKAERKLRTTQISAFVGRLNLDAFLISIFYSLLDSRLEYTDLYVLFVVHKMNL